MDALLFLFFLSLSLSPSLRGSSKQGQQESQQTRKAGVMPSQEPTLRSPPLVRQGIDRHRNRHRDTHTTVCKIHRPSGVERVAACITSSRLLSRHASSSLLLLLLLLDDDDDDNDNVVLISASRPPAAQRSSAQAQLSTSQPRIHDDDDDDDAGPREDDDDDDDDGAAVDGHRRCCCCCCCGGGAAITGTRKGAAMIVYIYIYICLCIYANLSSPALWCFRQARRGVSRRARLVHRRRVRNELAPSAAAAAAAADNDDDEEEEEEDDDDDRDRHNLRALLICPACGLRISLRKFANHTKVCCQDLFEGYDVPRLRYDSSEWRGRAGLVDRVEFHTHTFIYIYIYVSALAHTFDATPR